MVARGFDCSLLELDVIGDALRLDVRPFPFQFPVHGELAEERNRLIGAAHATLTARNLIEGPHFAPELEDLLGVFARGRLAIAMLGSVRGDSRCARVVTDGRLGVLAQRRGQSVHFGPIPPDGLVRAVLDLLPPMRPGPGRSATIAVDAARPPPQRRGQDEDFGNRKFLEAARPPRDAAASQRTVIDRIMRRPRLGSGYFTVAARGRNAREGEPLTMNWLDTAAGRYVVVPATGADGRLHVTYTPADAARLAHKVAAHAVQQYDDTLTQTSSTMPAWALPPAKPAPPGSPPSGVRPQPTGGPNTPPSGGAPPAFIPRTGSSAGSPGPGSTSSNPSPGSPCQPPNMPPGSSSTGNQTTNASDFAPPPGQFGNPAANQGQVGSPNAGVNSGQSGGIGPNAGVGGGGSLGGVGGFGGARGAAGGTAGAPMGGGRGGRGGEEQEHKRPSWLLENDEGIFGTDERTAPPVIGA